MKRERGVTTPSGITRTLRMQRALVEVVEVEAVWAAGQSVRGLDAGARKRELEAAVDDYLRFHGDDRQRSARRIAETG